MQTVFCRICELNQLFVFASMHVYMHMGSEVGLSAKWRACDWEWKGGKKSRILPFGGIKLLYWLKSNQVF